MPYGKLIFTTQQILCFHLVCIAFLFIPSEVDFNSGWSYFLMFSSEISPADEALSSYYVSQRLSVPFFNICITVSLFTPHSNILQHYILLNLVEKSEYPLSHLKKKCLNILYGKETWGRANQLIAILLPLPLPAPGCLEGSCEGWSSGSHLMRGKRPF